MNKKIFHAVVLLTVLLFSLWGCKRLDSDPIVVKLANGQALSLDEATQYNSSNESKAQYNKWAEELKKEIREKAYKPYTFDEADSGKRMYRDNDGRDVEFDISSKACQPFGFSSGDYVETTRGKGYVVGVKDNNLWFHVEQERGATYWGDYNKKDFFETHKFKIIKSNAPKIKSNGSQQAPVVKTTNDSYDAYFAPIKPIPYLAKR